MARLPTPGGDSGNWGNILNEFLEQIHDSDGSLKANSVTSDALAPDAVDQTVIADNSITENKLDTTVQVKLNGVGGVSSVAGKTGVVSLTPADVGLGNVDNTSDAAKNAATATLTNKDLSSGTNTFPASLVTLTGTHTLTNKTLTNPKVNTVCDTNGNAAMLVMSNASAVNYLQIANAPTGGGPYVMANGSDINVNLGLYSKGTGYIGLYSSNGVIFSASPATTSPLANNLQANATATGVSPSLSANGTDTNINLDLVSKGTGVVQANGVDVVTVSGTQTLTNKTLTDPAVTFGVFDRPVVRSNGKNVLTFDGSASAVNWLQVNSNVSGSSPSILSQGTDTDINLNLVPQGAGVVQAGGVPVVTTTDTQTLTNKTLTAPIISTISNTGTLTLPTTTGTLALTSDITAATGMLAPVQGMTVGSETFTITAGSVTQVSGTTINGYTPAIGDRILIANAPATTGFGSSYSMTSQPTNGIYTVTGNTTNLSVTRANDMSGSVKPNGMTVYVQNANWPGSKTLFFVEYPNDASAFTWGTTSISWKWAGGLSGQQQQIWLGDKSLSLNIWNGTGWSKLVPSNNAGTQTLAMPATATSDTLVGRASTDTLTNKRVTPRVGTVTSSATPAINTDLYDQFNITALATDITSLSSGLSGTPTDGQSLLLRIKDNGTARVITWGASWRAIGVILPTMTVISKTMYVGTRYNSTDSKWDVLALGMET